MVLLSERLVAKLVPGGVEPAPRGRGIALRFHDGHYGQTQVLAVYGVASPKGGTPAADELRGEAEQRLLAEWIRGHGARASEARDGRGEPFLLLGDLQNAPCTADRVRRNGKYQRTLNDAKVDALVPVCRDQLGLTDLWRNLHPDAVAMTFSHAAAAIDKGGERSRFYGSRIDSIWSAVKDVQYAGGRHCASSTGGSKRPPIRGGTDCHAGDSDGTDARPRIDEDGSPNAGELPHADRGGVDGLWESYRARAAGTVV